MERVCEHSMWTKVLVLLPTYLGLRTSQIKIEEINVTWVVAALSYSRDENIIISQIPRSFPLNWLEKTIEILIRATP